MDPLLFDSLTKGLVSAGLPCLLLGIAVWWFHQRWRESQEASTNRHNEFMVQQKEFIEAMNKERNERLDVMERGHAECEKDRFSLREQLIALLREDHDERKHATQPR